MNFTVKAFAELSPAELHAIYTARVAVFVVEQACPYQEVDAQDLTALHIFAEQNGKVIAYCRLIPHGDSVHLGRVLVLPGHRAEKLGRKIVVFAVDHARAHFPQCSVYAQAQAYLERFTPRLDLPANPPRIWKTIFRILICYCPPRNHSGSTRLQ